VYQDANIKVTASEHAHFRTHLILTGDDDPDAHHYVDAVKKLLGLGRSRRGPQAILAARPGFCRSKADAEMRTDNPKLPPPADFEALLWLTKPTAEVRTL